MSTDTLSPPPPTQAKPRAALARTPVTLQIGESHEIAHGVTLTLVSAAVQSGFLKINGIECCWPRMRPQNAPAPDPQAHMSMRLRTTPRPAPCTEWIYTIPGTVSFYVTENADSVTFRIRG